MKYIFKIVISLTILVLISLILPFLIVNAAQTAAPKVAFVSQPKSTYITGEPVNFKICSKAYSGRVQYSAVLYNNNTKQLQGLWKTKDGYNGNTSIGKNTNSLQWKIKEPGNYKITVYAKRAGFPAKKTLFGTYNYDSTATSISFSVSKTSNNIALGSSRQDVLDALGKPLRTLSKDGIDFMEYSNGFVYLNKSGKKGGVVGWYNNGIPKIVQAVKDPKAIPFRIGSSMAEVARSSGTPKFVPPYYLNEHDDYWIFSDDSIVFYNKDQKVVSYINRGKLKVSLGKKDTKAPLINHKSKIKDVVAAMGTPDSVNAFFIESADYSKYHVSVTRYTNPISMSYSVSINTQYTYYQYKDSFIAFDKNEKLIHFINKGNLKLDFGKKDPGFAGLTVYSSEDDIVKAMGTPDKIIDNSGGYHRNWFYGDSYIMVDDNGKLEGWVDKGNLNINKKLADSDAPIITIGSSKQDVLNAMGTPDNFNSSAWSYGESCIYFENTNCVTWIDNPINVKISNRSKNPASKGFAFGSSTDEVIEAMGVPYRIKKEPFRDNYIVWLYGHDQGSTNPKVSIYFNLEGKVVYWDSAYNDSIELKISTIPQYNPYASPITIGSTKEDVLKVMGAPTSLFAPEYMEGPWFYGHSYIAFGEDGKVLRWYDNDNNLRTE
jgi:outer membrane protein assembly factor BamE (lipoprotein component of BamABCDE complex)